MNNILKRLSRVLVGAVMAHGLWLGAPIAAQAQTQGGGAGGQAASPVSATGAQYRLAPGDVIRVAVFQNADLTLETRVNETGSISFPLLGSVAVGGLTLTQAEKRISDGLRDGNFVKQPQVSVIVTQVRGHQVSVLGQVGRPGRYPLEQADTKLTDIIAAAGGIGAAGGDMIVLIGTRNGQPFRSEFSLPSVFGTGKRGEDVILRNGDSIWVERAPVIYVYGEVQRPGSLRLERGMTVMQALATAGGITQRGTVKGLSVNRRDADDKVQTLTPGLNDPLRPDDVVYIRESIF